MNEEEMARRIERLEEEFDTIKTRLMGLDKMLEATRELLGKWKRQ